MNAEQAAYEALRMAQIESERTEKPMKSSSIAAAGDAASCFHKGQFRYAHARAMESLAYSVGVFAMPYLKAQALALGVDW